METALKLWNSDAVTSKDDSGTNRVSLAFLVLEWFKSIADSFYKSGLFFSMNIFFPIYHHAPCKSCTKFPDIWGVCRVHSVTSSLALKIPLALSLIREESPWSCLSNGANLFRLSKYLGSSWPVVTCDFFVHKNPIGRLVELASEHRRLLVIFVIKKYGNRP